MPFISYRYLTEKYEPEPYSKTIEPPALSAYKPTKEDLGSEEEPLPADHSLRPRHWIRDRVRK